MVSMLRKAFMIAGRGGCTRISVTPTRPSPIRWPKAELVALSACPECCRQARPSTSTVRTATTNLGSGRPTREPAVQRRMERWDQEGQVRRCGQVPPARAPPQVAEHPELVDIVAPSGAVLTVGLGAKAGVLSYAESPERPPYYASHGNSAA